MSSETQLDEATIKALPKLVRINSKRPEVVTLLRDGPIEKQFLSTFNLTASPNCSAEVYCLLSNGYLIGQESVTDLSFQSQKALRTLQATLALSLNLFYARIILELFARRPPPFTVKSAAEWVASKPVPGTVKRAGEALRSNAEIPRITRPDSEQIRLGITLTDSRRLLRSFAPRDKLRKVLEVAHVEEVSAGNNEELQALRQVYPPRVFGQTDMETSLNDLGIKANTMLVVECQGSALANAEPVGFVGFLMAWLMSIIYWIKAALAGS